MNAAVAKVRQMPEHRVANGAIGDRRALDEIWDKCGYWFFRDVLDKGSVAEAKRMCVEGLIKLGYVDEGQTEPIWNGRNLDDFPNSAASVLDRGIYSALTDHPANQAFFKSVLGDTPVWLPMDYVRMKNPYRGDEPVKDPIEGRHQDAHGSRGLRFVTCWVPLVDMDASVGGLALAEGFHHRGLVVRDGAFPQIDAGVVPDDLWRYSDWHPGDMVIFHPTTPHSGLANYSKTFRLSVDLRVIRAHNANVPVIGTVESIDKDSITIKDNGGRGAVTLAFDDNSFCCIRGNAPLTRSEAIELLGPGKDVMALEQGGCVLVLRPFTNFENAR